jgi:putative addiction module CopG family antidote
MKIDLSPSLDKFVAEKITSGDYVDVSEVIRDSLRRWKEQEKALQAGTEWLEQEIQEGLESPDLPASKTFWTDLRTELHQEHTSGSTAR